MVKKKKKNQKVSTTNISALQTEGADWWTHIYPRPVDKEFEMVDDPYFSSSKYDSPKKEAKAAPDSKTEKIRDLIDSLSNRGYLFLLLFVGLLMWEWIDAAHYVEVQATVMEVSVITRDVPIFGSKYNAGGTARYDETWVEVQYYYNDEVYNANVLEHKDLDSECTTVFCHKKHPAKCRTTRLKYPKAHICLILMGLSLGFFPIC